MAATPAVSRPRGAPGSSPIVCFIEHFSHSSGLSLLDTVLASDTSQDDADVLLAQLNLKSKDDTDAAKSIEKGTVPIEHILLFKGCVDDSLLT